MTDEKELAAAGDTAVRNAVSRAIDSTGDTVEQTIDATKGATETALQSIGGVGKAGVRAGADILIGAMEAAGDVGSELGNVVKGAVIGVVRGTAEVAEVTVSSLVGDVRIAISGTGIVGKDIGIVATSQESRALAIFSSWSTEIHRTQKSGSRPRRPTLTGFW